jgi:hypothetical protein
VARLKMKRGKVKSIAPRAPVFPGVDEAGEGIAAGLSTPQKADAREFRIMGRSAAGKEELDTATGQDQADYLVREYRMAFGAGWSIWAEVNA